MSSQSDFSAEQLSAARNTAWHQDGRSLVTIESARNWIDHYGFVLFAPRAAQLGAPAPSFVETTLGAANEAPTAAETATARSLVARLTAEGSVVPLNLLGTPGDTPDFLASAKVFPYIFTMRGDKAWKQPPQTIGATKVSTLALKVYEALAEKGAMSAAELASELGRELTETAIARALGELWTQLRVIPQLGIDDNAPTLWELLQTRFVKAMKAGANAGQPSAMSALLSLYLAQAVAATEEEAAGFLSPITARSRVREVVNALTSGRQLDSTVVEGRQLLHVSGNLPEFAATPKPETGEEAEASEGAEGASEFPAPKKVGTGRIGKFASDARPREDYKGKPARSFGAGDGAEKTGPARKYGTGKDRAYSPRPDTNRRPFTRSADAKPSFSKPWDEDKRGAPAEGGEAATGAAPTERPARKPYGDKPSFGAKKSFGDRKPYGDRPSFGAKKSFGDRKPYAPREGSGGGEDRPRRAFGDKPSFGARPAFGERKSFGDRKPFGAPKAFGDRKPFPPREGSGGDDRPRRTFGAKPAFGGKPSFGGDRPYKPRREEGSSEGGGYNSRPSYPRRDESAAPRSFEPRSYEKKSYDRKPFTPREGGGEDRPRRSFGDKPGFGGKPSFGDRKPFGGAKSFGDRKPFTPREGGGEDRPRRSFGDKPSFGARPSFGGGGGGERKPFGDRKPGGFGAKPSFGAKPDRRPAFGAKPSFGSRGPSSGGGGKFGGAKPGGGGSFGAKKFGARPGGSFTKRPASGGGAPYRKPQSEE